MKKHTGICIKYCAAVILMLFGFGCSVQTVYYRMAAGPAGGNDLSFYQAPAANATAAGVPDGEVRNIIFLIGDGMGFNHVELARQFAGPSRRLWMDTLPVKGQVTTRSANKSITDSAAAGTALACGIKTDNGMIGVSPQKVAYTSILEALDRKGWRTGLAATSEISHATPAAFSAHVDSRSEQGQIARQQLENHVDVLLGGGRKYWDGQMLAEAKANGCQVIETREQLATTTCQPVIGLFADEGMTTFEPEPSLAEMAGTAMRVLSGKSPDWFAPSPRFFLMVEGSQIDWAAHANDTERTVRQTLLFDMAVREALEFAQRDGHTLVIVTADHETGGLRLAPTEDGVPKVKWTSGNHTSANVPLFAFGPGAERFAGTLDNTDIPKRIAELTGIALFPAEKVTAGKAAALVDSR
jgi:alkaline phosphatase